LILLENSQSGSLVGSRVSRSTSMGFSSAKFLYIFWCIDSGVIEPLSRDGLPAPSTHALKVSWSQIYKEILDSHLEPKAISAPDTDGLL
jgi:hypothetical protein